MGHPLPQKILFLYAGALACFCYAENANSRRHCPTTVLFYRPDPRKSQERNGLARLWLSADMTCDPTRNNPYELTEVMLQNTNFVFHLFGRKFSSNKDILQGTLEAILMLEKEFGKPVSKTPITEYGRRLNLIGGASSLDLWSKEDAARNAYDFMKPMM